MPEDLETFAAQPEITAVMIDLHHPGVYVLYLDTNALATELATRCGFEVIDVQTSDEHTLVHCRK